MDAPYFATVDDKRFADIYVLFLFQLSVCWVLTHLEINLRSVLIILLMCMSVAKVSAEDFNPEKYVAEGAVMLFWNACVKFYPNKDKFNNWIDQNDFDEVSNSMAGSFARGPESRVYSVNNSGVRYLLVAEPNGLCSVFVKDVNLDLAIQAFSRWQNAIKEKRWIRFDNVETKTKEKGQLTTTQYKYISSGHEVMTVMVSKAKQGLGSFQLAMSASFEPVVNQ